MQHNIVNDIYSVNETLISHLNVMKEIQYDFLWVEEFTSWENGDCSLVGLVNVYTIYLIENQTGGVFGERDSSIYEVGNLNNFIEKHFID